MSFRRKKEDVSAQREWKEFIHQNAGLIAEIGIPETICRSHDNFVYFRMHGNHPDDMSYFHSWALSPVQVERLITLLQRYFQRWPASHEVSFSLVTCLGHQSYLDELKRRLQASAPCDLR